MDFGSALKKARSDKKMTLRELGKSIEESIGYISDLEHNRISPKDLDQVKKIEKILGLNFFI